MGTRGDAGSATLRSLPAVHELAAAIDAPHGLAVAAARAAIEERRAAVLGGSTEDVDLVARARELLEELARPSLRRVINATGVILHTNLGRAPLRGERTGGGDAGGRGLLEPRAGPGVGRAGQSSRATSRD